MKIKLRKKNFFMRCKHAFLHQVEVHQTAERPEKDGQDSFAVQALMLQR